MHYGPGVDPASNRNEYQEYFLGGKGGRCVRLITYHHTVPLSRNLGALTSWNPLGLSRPEYFLGGKGGRCVRLITYHHTVPLSRNLGTLTFWNPLGLSRPVMGLLYFYPPRKPPSHEAMFLSRLLLCVRLS